MPTIALLQESGEQVFCLEWEGGMGAYARYVYKLNGAYYGWDMFDAANDGRPVMGAYETLQGAVEGCNFQHVEHSTRRVDSAELSFEELVSLLKPWYSGGYESILVNGRKWVPE